MCEKERLRKILISWLDDECVIDNILADFYNTEPCDCVLCKEFRGAALEENMKTIPWVSRNAHLIDFSIDRSNEPDTEPESDSEEEESWKCLGECKKEYPYTKTYFNGMCFKCYDIDYKKTIIDYNKKKVGCNVEE